MNSSPHLQSSIADKILTITLNRPEKMNCFGLGELERMEEVLKKNEQNRDVGVVVFQGAGDRAFSTGADLKQFNALDKPGLKKWIEEGHRVFNYIERYPRPTVAVIEGYALGGGLELALACDIRVASESAVFGMPELKHGWLPGWGGIHRLKDLVGRSKAKQIIYFAGRLTAEEAQQIGLIHFKAGKGQLEQKVEKLLDELIGLDPEAFSMAKAALSGPASADSPTPPDIWFDVLSTIYLKNRQ